MRGVTLNAILCLCPLLVVGCTIADLPPLPPDVPEVSKTPDQVDSETPEVSADVGPADEDASGEEDALESADSAEEAPQTCDWLVSPAPQPAHSGVVYVSHFDSSDLQMYRVDGAEPASVGTLDLGGLTHAMAVDPFNDLLFVALDLIGEVRLYQLSRPASAQAVVTPPQLVGTIVYPSEYPQYLAVDPHRQRLFVVVASFGIDVPPDQDLLFGYDVSDPSQPTELYGGPVLVPAAMALDIDVPSGILAMPGFISGEITLRDTDASKAPLLGGTPPDLLSLYPEEGDDAFQLRSLRFDSQLGRLLGARSQGTLSEVIAFTYPTVVGQPTDVCPPRPDHDSLSPTSDFFDLSVPVDDRPTLTEAFDVLPDPATGNSFLVANVAHDGEDSTVLIPQGSDLQPGPGCEHWAATDASPMGCFLRTHSGGVAGSYETTFGATCLDSTHRVVVGTSYDAVGSDPGHVHFFLYQPDLTMVPWLPADGDSLEAGDLPVAAICH